MKSDSVSADARQNPTAGQKQSPARRNDRVLLLTGKHTRQKRLRVAIIFQIVRLGGNPRRFQGMKGRLPLDGSGDISRLLLTYGAKNHF
jgi:hypothetical protein